MLVTIFNPPAADPVRQGTIMSRRKIHIGVLTAARTIRLANTRDTLQNSVGGIPVSDTTGEIEIEWFGELWIHGIVANAGPTLIDVDI